MPASSIIATARPLIARLFGVGLRNESTMTNISSMASSTTDTVIEDSGIFLGVFISVVYMNISVTLMN
jgi:hypothetical protein